MNERRESHRLFVLLLISSLVILGGCSSLPESADVEYNADEVIGACVGVISNAQRRGQPIRVVQADAEMPAAITWIIGRPDSQNPDQLNGTEYTEVVSINGTPLPAVDEDNPQTFEVLSCWTVKRVLIPSERPIPLPDAKKPLAGECDDNPQLRQVLSLTGVSDLSVHTKKREVVFFGERLKIAPHEGSTYLATNERVALNIHKGKFNYRVTLRNGTQYYGNCRLAVQS